MHDTVVLKEVTSPTQLRAAFAIRYAVFVSEQGIPNDIERDNQDAASRHLLAVCADVPIATARLTVMNDGEAVLARVAVLPPHRKVGVGRLLVKKAEVFALEANVRRITLHPHDYLERFYEELGYNRFGDQSTVGPHRLIEMEKCF